MTAGPRSPEQRFHRKVQKLTDDCSGCWLWTASHCRGYGYFWTGTRQQRAARWSYERYVGPIPEGYEVDHLCRTPACVNPTHLEAVTPQENMRRAWMARRAEKAAS